MKFLRVIGYGIIGLTMLLIATGVFTTAIGLIVLIVKFAPWILFIGVIIGMGLVGEEMRKDGVFDGTYDPKNPKANRKND